MCLWESLCHHSIENGRITNLQLYLLDDYEMSHAEYNQQSIRSEADRQSYVSDTDSIVRVLI